MLNLNSVIITGRLTREPETKYTGSGMAICSFSVAVNNPRKDKNGEWHNDTVFMDCTAFDKTAEKASSFPKGQQVCVEGKLKQDNWEAKDGSKRSKILIAVSSVKPFETAQRGDSGDSEGTYRASASRPSDKLEFDAAAVDDEIGF